VLKEGKITQLALYSSNVNGLQENQRNHFVRETLKNFQIWRAVLTCHQPKMSSFSVITGYVWFLSLQFFWSFIVNFGKQRLKQQSEL
jgi:hypothetical protein